MHGIESNYKDLFLKTNLSQPTVRNKLLQLNSTTVSDSYACLFKARTGIYELRADIHRIGG